MSSYINHVTLTTGQCRRSPRDEVSDETLALLYPWMTTAIESGNPAPLPVPALAHYSAHVLRDRGVVVTIYGPLGPHIAGQPYRGERLAPLVTLGIAQRSREAAPLWQMMVDTFGAPTVAKMPSVPWCAVALHPTLPMFLDAVTWLGDFERCVAWAWITRNPALSTVSQGQTK